ncbi:glucose-1-phosphate cytidylyltransferase [Candidatus Marinimicrobia bacterium]|nr:glucose-1-phosphate cytidylyltransferase [Candidatus Neomarinimicrobiota bacterium]
MDAIIFCGGKGTRLSEETINKPKPMVEIGGMPILWHIMKLYSYYGVNRFILALGYKGDQIKEYFYNYKVARNDFSLKLDPKDDIEYLNHTDEHHWEIVCVDTGEDTLKGGRIKRLEQHIKTDFFHLTYGDGVGDINIKELVVFHKSHDCIGTVTAVRPPSRFGELNIDKDNQVLNLEEKPQMGRGLINGGFFVFNKKILSYLTSDENCDFEFGPLQEIASNGQLKAFKHTGFWQCMDNIRERDFLDNQIKDKTAPWIVWK